MRHLRACVLVFLFLSRIPISLSPPAFLCSSWAFCEHAVAVRQSLPSTASYSVYITKFAMLLCYSLVLQPFHLLALYLTLLAPIPHFLLPTSVHVHVVQTLVFCAHASKTFVPLCQPPNTCLLPPSPHLPSPSHTHTQNTPHAASLSPSNILPVSYQPSWLYFYPYPTMLLSLSGLYY